MIRIHFHTSAAKYCRRESGIAQWTPITRNNMVSGYLHIIMQRKQEWSPCQQPINSSRHVRTLEDIPLGRLIRISSSCMGGFTGRSHPPAEARLIHGNTRTDTLQPKSWNSSSPAICRNLTQWMAMAITKSWNSRVIARTSSTLQPIHSLRIAKHP